MEKQAVVILDNIRSALNVGAVFRTCSGAGVKHLYLIGITPFPPHPKVIKTSLGTEQEVPFSHHKDIQEVLNIVKNNGYTLYAIEETIGSEDFFLQNLDHKSAFIFGHEITGVSPTAINSSAKILQLPMLGNKNSLNISTTVGIVLYNFTFTK